MIKRIPQRIAPDYVAVRKTDLFDRVSMVFGVVTMCLMFSMISATVIFQFVKGVL